MNLVLILAMGSLVLGILAGFDIADRLVAMGLVASDNHVAQLVIAAWAAIFTMASVTVSGILLQRLQQPQPSERARRPATPLVVGNWGPALALTGGLLLIVGTLVPWASSGDDSFSLVNFGDSTSFWLSQAFGWWTPTVVLAAASIRLLLFAPRGMLALGVLLGSAIALLTSYLALWGWNLAFATEVRAGLLIGTVGGALALGGALLPRLLHPPT